MGKLLCITLLKRGTDVLAFLIKQGGGVYHSSADERMRKYLQMLTYVRVDLNYWGRFIEVRDVVESAKLFLPLFSEEMSPTRVLATYYAEDSDIYKFDSKYVAMVAKAPLLLDLVWFCRFCCYICLLTGHSTPVFIIAFSSFSFLIYWRNLGVRVPC